MSLLERSALPIRPFRQSAESLPGYIYRLYNANGHPVPAEIHVSLSRLYSNAAQSQREAAAIQLAAVAGELSNTDWPRWRTWHRWLKQSYARARFCPICIQENHTHQSIWELPLVRTCPVHQTLLYEQCDCGRNLGWRWIGADWRCRCGKAIAELHASDAAHGMVVLSRLISASFIAEKGGQWPFGWRLPKEFQGLPLEALYAEIEFLHLLESKLNRHLGEVVTSKSPSTSVGMLLASWPRSFDAYLQEWLARYFAKDRGGAIVRLGRNMPLIRLLPTSSSSPTRPVVPSISGRRLKKYVECVRVPLQGPGVYLVDTALTGRLDSDWLRSFYMLTDRKPDSQESRTDKRASADSRQATVMRQVIRLFVASAVAKESVDTTLKRVVQTWPGLHEYAGGTPLEWLVHLIEPLHEACYTHLCYLRETLESVRDKTFNKSHVVTCE